MKKGTTLSGSFFVFKYIFNLDLPRYTFVVPKKVSSKAVERNKLKRRGLNVIRPFLFKNSMGIFFYKKTSIKASSQEIKEDIYSLLKKAKIII